MKGKNLRHTLLSRSSIALLPNVITRWPFKRSLLFRRKAERIRPIILSGHAIGMSGWWHAVLGIPAERDARSPPPGQLLRRRCRISRNTHLPGALLERSTQVWATNRTRLLRANAPASCFLFPKTLWTGRFMLLTSP